MKKSLKALVTLAGLISVPIIINKFIFNKAAREAGNELPEANEMFYDWRHGKIRYVVQGQGKPLVMLHGIGAGLSMYEWERNVHELSKHYRVYTLDLLGFGYSDKPQISYSAYLYITLINDFLREVVGEPANVIASSNSGAFALTGYIFEPELYSKMLLVSPTGIGSSANLPTSGDLWAKWLLETPIIGTSMYNLITSRFYISYFLKRFCYAYPSEVTSHVVNKYYSPAHYGGPNARLPIAAFISKFLNVEIESKIAQLQIPLNLVWGELNELNPVSNLNIALEKNPSIECTSFGNSKLLPHVDNPGLFNSICIEFFG